MLISTKGRYALRVLIDLAEHQSENYVPLKEIAARQEISKPYLESILKILVEHGILAGLRGKGGGYRLRRPPEQLKVGDILLLTEGSLAPVSCLEQGSARCGRMPECRTLPVWQGLNQVIYEYLQGYTIADLRCAGQPGDQYVI